MTTVYIQLGGQIKQLRQSLLLSQGELGKLCRLKQTAISRVESGTWSNAKVLERIAKALGCSLDIKLIPSTDTENLRIKIETSIRNPVRDIVTRRGQVMQKVGKEAFMQTLKKESIEQLSSPGGDNQHVND